MKPFSKNKTANKAVSLESIERQTKMSWATLLTKFEEIPPDFQLFFSSFNQEEAFPFSIITPSYEGFMHRSTEMLVCLTNDELLIANKNETLENALTFKFNDIQYVQFRTVLLESNLTITGYNSRKESVTIMLRFNTVSDFLFKKIVNRIRRYSFCEKKSIEINLIDEIRSENFKFANFAQHCLLPGEKVIQLIWQPELRKSLIHFKYPSIFRHFFRRRVFPNHVLMLTDQELILISEDDHHAHDDLYGGVWEYIPLSKVRGARLTQDQAGLITLSIALPGDQSVESRYLPSQKMELEILLSELKTARMIL